MTGHHFPAPGLASVVSVSGAGDCFTAGFIAAWQQGLHQAVTPANITTNPPKNLQTLPNHLNISGFARCDRCQDCCVAVGQQTASLSCLVSAAVPDSLAVDWERRAVGTRVL